ncbi:MAG: M23 family metallopeptidase [Sulfurimonas sp.]|nr:M23 family metallopeptidase [Sulfurimonas sp.]MDD3061146.1 M23 family metallopeptidase [Sulfurimonas sp.]
MRNSNKSSFGILVLLALIVGGVIYIFNSAMFERDVPEIKMVNNGYWNLKDPLKIEITDASGVKTYKVILKTAAEESVLFYEQVVEPKTTVTLEVKPPRSAYAMKENKVSIRIEALDASKWNFLKGNSITTETTLEIDKKKPQVSVLSNSYKITKGGSALVVFKAEDENLKELYILSNFNKKFKAQPFYKEGYYIGLFAWPVGEADFKADVIAEDKAGNLTKTYIPLYLKDAAYKVSNIALTDGFLKGKIAELADEFEETQGITDSIEQFKLINETVRAKNEKLIHSITSNVPTDMISDFKISKMYPLRNGQVVATFGDHRVYSYNENHVSDSDHMGLDLASNSMADITPQNDGDVVFSDYNGLYGNMPIVHHGLGLYTLYGHCSSTKVNSGEKFQAQSVIANTGKSGYAMGDHLHFGVLVQGIEVRPVEWMDSTWIQLNITDVIESAKKMIDQK